MTGAQRFSKREVERLYPNILNLPHHHMGPKTNKTKIGFKTNAIRKQFLYNLYIYLPYVLSLGTYPRKKKTHVHIKTLM